MTALLLALLALAGCASAPSSRQGSAAPPSLSLCSGVRISNAPASDSYRRVVGYVPYAEIRGRELMRAPVRGCVSSAYGPRQRKGRAAGSFHEGLDLYTGKPSPVVAAGDGRVIAAKTMRGYGRTVDIDHGRGVITRYAHMSTIARRVRPGADIARGTLIGETGDSGNATAVHLHYEIRIDGRAVDPLRAP